MKKIISLFLIIFSIFIILFINTLYAVNNDKINDENLEFSLYENDWRFSEDETDLLNILSDYDVTHIAIKHVDNSKEEFMVAWSDLEKDFLSSTFVRVDEANSMICIVIDLDKCQFDKHLERQESEENDL